MKKLAMVMLLGMACVGCKGMPVAVGRGFYAAINKPFRRYVNADQSLSAEQKERRIKTLDDHDAALKKAGG